MMSHASMDDGVFEQPAEEVLMPADLDDDGPTDEQIEAMEIDRMIAEADNGPTDEQIEEMMVARAIAEAEEREIDRIIDQAQDPN
jgi:hypothetical protein